MGNHSADWGELVVSPEVAVLQRIQAVAPTARVYQLKLPQEATLPAAVVQLVDDIKEKHLRGGSDSGVARIQVSVYRSEASGIDSYNESETLIETIHGDDAGSGLSAYTGVIGGSPDGLLLTGVFFAGRRAIYEPDEFRAVGIQEDYFAHYRRL